MRFASLQRATRTPSGFTLIEVLVVAAIIALATGIVAINFDRWYRAFALQGSLRSLISDLRVARNRSVMRGAVYKVEFSLDGNSYRVYSDADKYDRTVKMAPGLELIIIHSWEQAEADTVTFNPTTQIAGNTVVLRQGPKYFLIRINPVTGVIELENDPHLAGEYADYKRNPALHEPEPAATGTVDGEWGEGDDNESVNDARPAQ